MRVQEADMLQSSYCFYKIIGWCGASELRGVTNMAIENDSQRRRYLTGSRWRLL